MHHWILHAADIIYKRALQIRRLSKSEIRISEVLREYLMCYLICCIYLIVIVPVFRERFTCYVSHYRLHLSKNI